MFKTRLNLHRSKFWCTIYIFLISFSVFHTACRKKNAEWESEWAVPLVKTQLKLSDLLPSDILSSDSSGLHQFVFKSSLFNLNVDSLFVLPDTVRTRSFTIDSLSLYDASTIFPITLGEICRQAGILGLLIISNQGNMVPVGPIPSFNTPAFEISADTIFTSMTLDEGTMEISFKNELPIDITDVQFELKNKSHNAIIVSGTFPLIKSKEKVSQSFSLAGKTVEGKINAQIISFASPGSNGMPVLIDTANAIVTEIRVFNLRPNSATAIWPAQNLVNTQQDFNIRGLHVLLKEALIKSGAIRFRMKSSIPDSVRFTYTLPAAIKDGKSFEIHTTLPPAEPGQFSEFLRDYDFTGYTLDMSGVSKDTFNAAYNTYLVRIDSSGIMKTFSKSDIFILELGFVGIRPSYARGYLTTDTFRIEKQTTNIDVFKELSGKINFDNAHLELSIENNIGADASITLHQLVSSNTNTGLIATLDGDSVYMSHNIPRASDQGGMLPVSPGRYSINISNENSNITELINLLPDQLEYSVDIITNPNGNISDFNDFIYDGKLLNLDLEVAIPLSINAEGLTLVKTMDLDLYNQNFDEIISGKLHFLFTNWFPFECQIVMHLLNDDGSEGISLIDSGQRIQSAKSDSSGKVIQPEESLISIPLDSDLIKRLSKNSKIKVKTNFSTKPIDTLVKIYDSYFMDLKVTGEFNYLNK
ncbi:MAG: hypothetical protein IPM48_12545 [Saprospiraceae bacterium]|nr:hypothetical protein [Saprospiraceae bacterium]